MNLDVKDPFSREQSHHQLVELVDGVIKQAWSSLLLEKLRANRGITLYLQPSLWHIESVV